MCGVGDEGFRKTEGLVILLEQTELSAGAVKVTGQVPRKESPRAKMVIWPSVGEGLGLVEELCFLSLKQNSGRKGRRVC